MRAYRLEHIVQTCNLSLPRSSHAAAAAAKFADLANGMMAKAKSSSEPWNVMRLPFDIVDCIRDAGCTYPALEPTWLRSLIPRIPTTRLVHVEHEPYNRTHTHKQRERTHTLTYNRYNSSDSEDEIGTHTQTNAHTHTHTLTNHTHNHMCAMCFGVY